MSSKKKLTLSVDEGVIERARRYSIRHDTSISQLVTLRAVSLGWEEVEDAVQGISAQRAEADFIVTRNAADFEAASVPVVTPKQLLATLASSPD